MNSCPKCHANIWKNGVYEASFDHVFSSHHVSMQIWRCSNKACKWNKTSSLVRQLSGTMHLDLIKLQAENGANTSYRKAANGLTRTVGKRRINNHSWIRSVTNTVGNILAEHQLKDEGQVLEAAELGMCMK